jgi:energy-coupling factor transporter ATP-binding protein EcfA2
MRIVKASFRNIMGIEDMTIIPGAFTLFEGDNAAGKSSGLEALKYAVDKGHDGDILRDGATEGAVVLTLDDGMVIQAVITPTETKRWVNTPKGGRLSKAAGFLDQIRDQVSVNPLAFLLAPAKEQAQLLLETMPLHVDPQKVTDAAGIILTQDDLAGDALEVLDRVRRMVYDRRTGVNRLLSDKQATARQLGETLGEEAPPPPDVHALRNQLEESAGAAQQTTRRIQNALEQAKEAARAKAARSIEEIRTELERGIEALRERAAIDLQEALQPFRRQAATLEAEIAAADQVRRRWEAYQATRKLADRAAFEASAHEDEATRLTESLARLDQLKGDLLATLPIKGLEIREGKIYLDGVSFRRTNTARRIAFGLTISALRAPPETEGLRVVIVDDLSHFGAKNFAELERAMLASGLQFFGAKVAEGPLRVETKG